MFRDTVDSEISIPSFNSSPWIRGAPQPSCAIKRMRSRISRSPRATPLGDLRPVAPESLPAPSRYGVAVDDNQATRPPWPGGTEGYPEGTVDIVQERSRPLALQRQDLLPQREVLDREVRAGHEQRPDSVGDQGDHED